MKIAICLHGLSLGRNTLRDITRSNPDIDWKCFTKTISNNLINLNKADVFIHTWNHQEVEELKSFYNPKGLLVEPQKEFNPFFSNEILNQDKEDFALYMKNDHSPLIYTHPRVFSHMYSFDRADSLRQAYETLYGFRYDYVIKTRFDLQILKPLDVTKYDNTKMQFGRWWGAQPKALEDLFIIGNSTHMTKLSSLYHKMYEYLINEEYNYLIRSMGLGAFHFASAHELLYYHVKREGLLGLIQESFDREVDFSLDRSNFDFMKTGIDV
jgi:hypothetical protein